MIRALLILLSGIVLFNTQPSQAGDCSVGILKTYLPRSPGKNACDDKDLPAEFAANLSTLAQGLKERGYFAQKFDQCANGSDDKNAYSLVSQLGDCVQTGNSMSCKLYVALYDNGNNKAVFENTISGVGIGAVSLHISEALDSLPNCSSL
jgi:hypothetical protein